MRKGTESISSRCLRIGATPIQRNIDPNAERLASLAAMTVARQSPGLVLPFLTSIPTSFTHTTGDDNTLTLARSLVELGLGTAELWERHNSNTSAFIRDSIGAWLSEIGADEMNGETDVDLAIFDALDNEASQPMADSSSFWTRRMAAASSP